MCIDLHLGQSNVIELAQKNAWQAQFMLSIDKICVNKMQWAKKVRNKSNQRKSMEKSDNFQAWRIKQMTLAIVEIARLGDTL